MLPHGIPAAEQSTCQCVQLLHALWVALATQLRGLDTFFSLFSFTEFLASEECMSLARPARHFLVRLRVRAKITVSVMLAVVCPVLLLGRGALAQVVISQIYPGGGAISVPSEYLYDYVELFNNSDTAIDLSGYSLQYSSAAGTAIASVQGVLPLGGVIAPHNYFLIQTGQSGVTGGMPAIAPDFTPTSPDVGPSLGRDGGKVILALGSTAITFTTGSLTTLPANVVDFVGWGTANTYEGTGAAPAPGSTFNSLTRTLVINTMTDTNDNAVDFRVTTVSLHNSLSLGTAAAPEPGTCLLLGTGLLPLAGIIRKRRQVIH
jgi:5'-nucleotidase